MVLIPPEVQIRAVIKSGSVYYFPKASFSSPEPHYFVVLNHSPLDDTFLVLVCASSQIEKIKRRRLNCPTTTLVEMTPADYASFKKPTIIDCNEVYEHTVDDLVSMRSKYDLITKPEMDAGIVATLRQAVCASPLVIGKIKAMLAGPVGTRRV